MELVRDNNDSFSVRAHIAQHGEEPVRFLWGEHGCRLIENQNVGIAVEHLDNLHRLLLGDGHVIDLLLRVYIKAVAAADVPDFLGGGLHVKRLLQPEDNILGGSEHIHQLEVLVHHSDAQRESILRRADDNFLPVYLNGALIRKVDAGEHVHQSGLPASVFSENGENLSPVDIQPDLIICNHLGAEALGDVSHFYNGFFVIQKNSSCARGCLLCPVLFEL